MKPRKVKPITWTCGACGAQTVSTDGTPKYEHREGCAVAHVHAG